MTPPPFYKLYKKKGKMVRDGIPYLGPIKIISQVPHLYTATISGGSC